MEYEGSNEVECQALKNDHMSQARLGKRCCAWTMKVSHQCALLKSCNTVFIYTTLLTML